jgi:glycerol-3-phosphate O-acyltransferase/dihydroxyacetone phosphate acyltransferase
MLYAFVRPLAKIGISIFFRRIYLTHTENIPKNKPVILACNHPTAFLEPCILACFLDRPLYYLVRGDYFDKPIYNFFLRALHMLPVYRRRDGDYSRIKDNFATFDACFDTLKKNKTLTIYPEGRTLFEYRLRSLKKGIGRIAMGLFDKYPDIEEAYIVPVGVNYTNFARFRSNVMIECGKPIPVRSYWEKYKDNPNQGVVQILQDLAPLMEKEMVVIEDPDRDELGQQLLEANRPLTHTYLLPTFSKDDKALKDYQETARIINGLSDKDWKKVGHLQKEIQAELSKEGLERATLLGLKVKQGATILKVILLAIPALVGYVINWPFIQFARNTVDKRIRRFEYRSPVLVGMSIGLYTALGLLSILLSLILWNAWLLLLLPFFLLTGIAWIAFDHFRHLYIQGGRRRRTSQARQAEMVLKVMEQLDVLSR